MTLPASPESSNPPGDSGPRTFWGRLCWFLALSGLGVLADLYSKFRVFEALGYPAGQSALLWDGWIKFRCYTSFNRGALWGIGQGWTGLFILFSLLAVGFILYWLIVRRATRSRLLTASLALILAGTLGNLYDRLGWHGCRDHLTGEPMYAVRDFLLFQFGTWDWPVFNLADVLLVTGAGCLVIQSFVESQPASR